MGVGGGGTTTTTNNNRAFVHQMNIETVSKATLGKRRRNEVEWIWAFPSAQIPS